MTRSVEIFFSEEADDEVDSGGGVALRFMFAVLVETEGCEVILNQKRIHFIHNAVQPRIEEAS